MRGNEESFLPLVIRLFVDQDLLDKIPARVFKPIVTWVIENLIEENLFTVENWLEISFHLCKQRWNESLDWLEKQPMSKIHTMIQIVKNHAEEQEKQMKKSAKKK